MSKKLIMIFLLSASLYSSDEKMKELFDYSHVCVNDAVSFYAGKIYMQNFQNEHSYSVGLLLHKEKNTSTDFGVGYMQPVDQIDSLLVRSPEKTDVQAEDGVLFFMNYHF